MATILITCVGSGVGQSIIDSLNLKGNHKLIGCDGNRNVYAYAYCDTFFTVPGIYSEEYVEHLIDLCVQESVDLVVPGHDHELLLFSKDIEKFRAKGIEVLVSEPEIIEVSRDKQKWYDYFSKFGCRIVPTFSVKEFKKNPDTSMFPAIVKPVGGSASQGISVLNDLSEINIVDDNDIIQPYLFPKQNDNNYDAILKAVKRGDFIQKSEISIQLIFSKESKFSGIFISKNTLKSGVPVFVDPIKPEEFEYLDEILKFVPVCEEKGVKGPVNIQGRITEEGLFFFEMNMRFTGITGNRALLGFNEVDFLVNNFLGRPAVLEGHSYNKLGVRQVACATIPRAQLLNPHVYTVLGGGGFVGSHFINSLIETNRFSRIYLICRKGSYEDYVVRFQTEKIKVYAEDDPFLETVYCQTDVLVNFASALAYMPETDIYKSVIFQYEQIQKMSRTNIPLVINVSSQSVYDQADDVEKEEQAEIVLNSAYCFQKYISERFFASLTKNANITKTVSLRATRILGGTDRKVNGFFAKAVDTLLNNQEVNVANPQNKTNLIDVRDVVSAINWVISNANTVDFPEILNMGGENLSLQDYFETVLEVLNDQGKRELLNFSNNNEVKSTAMVKTDAINALGWQPEYTVKDMVTVFVESVGRKIEEK